MPTDPAEETRTSLDGSAQATLISGVCNSILLFCGLLVAGTFTVVTSSRFSFDDRALVAAIAAVFGLGFVAGIVALVGIMQAHNLARREAKFRLGVKVETGRIEAARRNAVYLSVTAFYLTTAASVAAFVVVVMYLFFGGPAERPQPIGITIVRSANKTTITIGKAPEVIQMVHDGMACKTVVPTDDGQITIDSSC